VRRIFGVVPSRRALFDSIEAVYENVSLGLRENNRFIPRREMGKIASERLAMVDLPVVETSNP